MEDKSSPTFNSISTKNIEKKAIKIEVIELKNIIIRDFPIEIEIKIQYGEINIGEIHRSTVETPEVKINFTTFLEIDSSIHEELNKLAGTPLVFIVSELPGKGKKSIKEDKVTFGGRCYLDLLPFLLGETMIVDQPLLVELSAFSIGQDMVPWTHLPVLLVDVVTDEPLVPKEIARENNLLFLTIESIYNVSPKLPENLLFKAAIEIPIDDEIFETVIFDDGLQYAIKDPENIKLWHGLPHLPGWNAMTRYRISEDHHEIQNQTGNCIDFKSIMNQDSRHIKWNTLKRFYMTKSATENLKKLIYMKRCWPIEFVAEMKKENQKSQESQMIMHLISYLDLSSLTYPGLSRIRIASPILSFDQEEFSLKSRTEKPLFDVNIVKPSTPQMETSPTIKGKKKKESARRRKSDDSSFDPQLLLDSQMFVIIEVEFLRPVVEEPSKEYLFARMNELVPPLRELPQKLCSIKYAEESFRDCLKVLRGKLYEEYCNFLNHAKKSGCRKCTKPFVTGLDILPEFTQYMISRNTYSLIKETLKSHVINMFQQKYGVESHKGGLHHIMEETQNFFIYMIEEMHKSLNFYVDGNINENSLKDYPSTDMQLYFALEALEENKYGTAKEWYLKRLEVSERDPELWMDYGLYFLRIGETEDAMLCIKKVLEIEQKHCAGLLLYAILLTERNFYNEARIFFQALTKIYNNFVEGWIAFNIYFIITEDKVGQEETSKKVSKITSSSINDHIRQYPIMCWRDMDNLSSQYLQTASLFLKINAFKFAELALAKELAVTQDPESIPYCYYSAVLSYQQGNFDETYNYISKIVNIENKNYLIWSLYGHTHYKLGMKRCALSFFKYVFHYLQCPDDLHMMYLRMGFLYISESDRYHAMEMFVNACAYHPTPFSWFQAGITAYEAGDYDIAELTLSESNTLDKYDAKTWGYLALVNLSLQRMETFIFCFKQAKILKLENEDLEKINAEIKNKMFPV